MHNTILNIKLSLAVVLFITSLSGFANEGEGMLKGRVINDAGEPIPFVNVGFRALSIGAITDLEGHFQIGKIPYGKHLLTVSSIGYKPLEKEINITQQVNALTHNFQLKKSTQSLDEVVVVSGTMKEATKLQSPVPVEVYAAPFFKANPTPSVFESLQTVNGVKPQINCNICNTGDIHINGLEGPYTMVLIDGMPIVSGLSTVYGLTGIPQSLIERVEIVKGPASTLYGSEAVGGLINIITKKPLNAPLVSADVFGTSWGEINTDVGARYRLGERTQGLLGVNYFNYQFPIDKNEDGFTDITLQNRISIFNKISKTYRDQKTFSFAGRYVFEDRWGGEMNWEKQNRGGDEVYGESIYTHRWELFGSYDLPFGENVRFQFSANGHDQNSVYGDMTYIADQYIGFGQLTWNRTIQKHDLLLGAAYRYTYYDDNTTATYSSEGFNEPSIIELPGLFIQDEVRFTDQHKLLLGMRYDYNSVHGNILSPRINYKWNSADQTTVFRLSAGNGFRVANVFTEDHAALTGAREVIFEEALNPETSWNTNLNLVKKYYTLNETYIGFDASMFYTFFNNAILPDYETDPNKILYGNLNGSAVSKGVSLNVDLNWANGLKIMAGSTLMDVSVTENGETFRQLLTERFSGVWNASYTFPSINLTIDYTGNVFAPMRLPILGALDDRPEYSAWYSIQNLQLTKSIDKKWEIYGGVKNLLNFTPPANSIARSFDPFDEQVQFDTQGEVIPTPNNPNALTFDPSYVFAPNQGIRGFLGIRLNIQ